jgi:peptide chain release factor 2
MTLKQDYQVCGGYFDLDSKNLRIKELENELSKPDFWNDQNSSNLVIQELNELKSIVKDVTVLSSNVKGLVEMINTVNDSDSQELIEEELLSSRNELEKLELFILLDEAYDKNNCIFEIHSGAGGTEACDWAMMLYRMYLRWCEKKNYKVTLLDYQDGEEAGIKSVAILIKGMYAYGYLKNEKGVHRLVRLSPFDSNNRRHTSFASA